MLTQDKSTVARGIPGEQENNWQKRYHQKCTSIVNAHADATRRIRPLPASASFIINERGIKSAHRLLACEGSWACTSKLSSPPSLFDNDRRRLVGQGSQRSNDIPTTLSSATLSLNPAALLDETRVRHRPKLPYIISLRHRSKPSEVQVYSSDTAFP
jgi:hypothetical protein